MVALLRLIEPRHATTWADAIIEEWDEVGPALVGNPARLLRVTNDPRPAMLFDAVREVATIALQADMRERPVLGAYAAMERYVRFDAAYLPIERVCVLYLNVRNVLIRDEVVSEGSVDHAAVYVREIVQRALELGACGLILVHNHPSGDPTPSRQDMLWTREIAGACKPLGIIVHDHIVMASKGHVSLRAAGLM